MKVLVGFGCGIMAVIFFIMILVNQESASTQDLIVWSALMVWNLITAMWIDITYKIENNI